MTNVCLLFDPNAFNLISWRNLGIAISSELSAFLSHLILPTSSSPSGCPSVLSDCVVHIWHWTSCSFFFFDLDCSFLSVWRLFLPFLPSFPLLSHGRLSYYESLYPRLLFTCRLSTTWCHFPVSRSCPRRELTHGFIDLLYDRCPIADLSFYFLTLSTFLFSLWRVA